MNAEACANIISDAVEILQSETFVERALSDMNRMFVDCEKIPGKGTEGTRHFSPYRQKRTKKIGPGTKEIVFLLGLGQRTIKTIHKGSPGQGSNGCFGTNQIYSQRRA